MSVDESSVDGTRADELVVLLDDENRPVGSMPKRLVHGETTPLHLAFSVYVFDPAGRFLVTRRALGKQTWPGVWTNSCCGHPAPDESLEDAARRRLDDELGLGVASLEVVLPDFAYQAVSSEGLMENEFCPVLVARADRDPSPRADEVSQWAWVDWEGWCQAVASAPWAFSPWAVRQTPLLAEARPARR